MKLDFWVTLLVFISYDTMDYRLFPTAQGIYLFTTGMSR